MRYGWFQQGSGERPAEEQALGLHGQPDAVRVGRTPGKIPAQVNLQLGKVVSSLLFCFSYAIKGEIYCINLQKKKDILTHANCEKQHQITLDCPLLENIPNV